MDTWCLITTPEYSLHTSSHTPIPTRWSLSNNLRMCPWKKLSTKGKSFERFNSLLNPKHALIWTELLQQVTCASTILIRFVFFGKHFHSFYLDSNESTITFTFTMQTPISVWINFICKFVFVRINLFTHNKDLHIHRSQTLLNLFTWIRDCHFHLILVITIDLNLCQEINPMRKIISPYINSKCFYSLTARRIENHSKKCKSIRMINSFSKNSIIFWLL